MVISDLWDGSFLTGITLWRQIPNSIGVFYGLKDMKNLRKSIPYLLFKVLQCTSPTGKAASPALPERVTKVFDRLVHTEAQGSRYNEYR